VICYAELLGARWEAAAGFRPADAVAVPLSAFLEGGVRDTVLLWLLYRAHVAHLRASPESSSGLPILRLVNSVRISEASWFSLTDRGVKFGENFLADVLVPAGEDDFERAWDALLLGLLLPHYNHEDRVFTWGAHVLKCFRQPSVNQEIILRAAQELGWAAWFDDPLPRHKSANPKVRLHDTIKDLNRRQVPYLVHFKGDGSGRRVGWEFR
jgi:hypothetical protein